MYSRAGRWRRRAEPAAGKSAGRCAVGRVFCSSCHYPRNRLLVDTPRLQKIVALTILAVYETIVKTQSVSYRSNCFGFVRIEAVDYSSDDPFVDYSLVRDSEFADPK